VRTYARKATRRSDGRWSMQSLHVAVVGVKSKSCSLNQAANDFEIPEATLRRYVKREPNDYPLNMGRYRPVSSAELEDKLATYLLELGKRYYGMTNLQVRKLA
jgi:helix-turn-helix, Psq domain